MTTGNPALHIDISLHLLLASPLCLSLGLRKAAVTERADTFSCKMPLGREGEGPGLRNNQAALTAPRGFLWVLVTAGPGPGQEARWSRWGSLLPGYQPGGPWASLHARHQGEPWNSGARLHAGVGQMVSCLCLEPGALPRPGPGHAVGVRKSLNVELGTGSR